MCAARPRTCAGKGGTSELAALREKAPRGAVEEELVPLVVVVGGEEVKEESPSVGASPGACEAGVRPMTTGIA